MTTYMNDILKLPVDEKLEIVEQIVKSLRENNDNDEIPDWHIKILQERLQKYEGSLTEGKSWEEVKRSFVKA